MTDERHADVVPTVGVSRTDKGCYKAARACTFDFWYPYDEAKVPIGANSGFALGFQYDLHNTRMEPGPVRDLEFSDDLCPGQVLASPPPENPLAKPGMISESELDTMGASVETERARTKQGGCCGQPASE